MNLRRPFSVHRPRDRRVPMTRSWSQPAWQRTSTLPLSASAIDRLGCRSSWAGHRAIQADPTLKPPSAKASDLLLSSARPSSVVHGLIGSDFDWRKSIDPGSQIVGQHKRAAPALHRSQRARFDCLVECGSSGTSHDAGLRDAISQRCIHVVPPKAEMIRTNPWMTVRDWSAYSGGFQETIATSGDTTATSGDK